MTAGASTERVLEALLAEADIRIGGARPWDLQVRNSAFFQAVLTRGSLGAGEAYMEGWWDCERLDELVARIRRAKLDRRFGGDWRARWRLAATSLWNLQSPRLSRRVVSRHYELPVAFFELFLDPRLQYSGAYFRDTQDLTKAQEEKLDRICRKLHLRAFDTLLDVGCGWGGLVQFAAEQYGCRAVGVNLSSAQVAVARERCQGLPVEIRRSDYRDLLYAPESAFDKVVSVGMLEHVGHRNYRTFMKIVRHSLKEDGLFLLQTVGGLEPARTGDPWTDRYIFPGGMLPSEEQLSRAASRLLVTEDFENLGLHYEKTLLAWNANLERNWERIRQLDASYDERLKRMWNFYLLSFAGSFRARYLQLWQIVYSRDGIAGGYESVR